MSQRSCQPTGRACSHIHTQHSRLQNADRSPCNAQQDLATHIAADPQHSPLSPVVLPAPPSSPSHRTRHREGPSRVQPPPPLILPAPGQHVAWDNPMARPLHWEEEEKPPGMSQQLHPFTPGQLKAKPCQGEVSSTHYLLSAPWQQGDTSKATLRCATCKGLLIPCLVRHEGVGKPLPRGERQRQHQAAARGEPRGKGVMSRAGAAGLDPCRCYCCFRGTSISCPDGKLSLLSATPSTSPRNSVSNFWGLCSCWGAAAGEPRLAQQCVGAAEAGHEWKSLSSTRPHTGTHAPRWAHPIILLKESWGRWSPRATPPYRRGGQAAICSFLCIFSVTPGLPQAVREAREWVFLSSSAPPFPLPIFTALSSDQMETLLTKQRAMG